MKHLGIRKIQKYAVHIKKNKICNNMHFKTIYVQQIIVK